MLVKCFFILFLCLAILQGTAQSKCITPVGLGDRVKDAIPIPKLNLPESLFAPTFLKHFAASLIMLEAPVQYRIFQTLILPAYSAEAMFHPTALDAFARPTISAGRRRCQPRDSNPRELSLFQLHRKVTLAYTMYFFADALPEAQPGFCKDLLSWGLSCTICSDAKNCKSTDTPWGLAFQLVHETLVNFGENDGWNANGALSRAVNRIPYEDWRGRAAYTPVNPPWEVVERRRWQPLLESTGRGFLFYQRHVTPHVGESGLSVFLGDDEHCKLSSRDPAYDLAEEVRLAIERRAALNDTSKAEVIAFDQKLLSLIPLQVQYFQRSGVDTDSFEFLLADLLVVSSIYEATLAVWRQKTTFDGIRPPSLIHSMLRGKSVMWEGGRRIGAEEWEPYIRTMPHAEFPSGSACVCKAFEMAMRAVSGTDDVARILGGPLVLTVAAGSSQVEPGKVPARDVALKFFKWSEVTKTCGRSRLNGGMHFTKAVPAGEKLCAGIASIVHKAMDALREGRRPDYVAPWMGVRRPKKHRCALRRRKMGNEHAPVL